MGFKTIDRRATSCSHFLKKLGNRHSHLLQKAVIESLETRKLLSTYTVNSLSDSGTGSLRWAVAMADADTTDSTVNIEFDPTLTASRSATINLSSGAIDISNGDAAVNIHGPSTSNSLTITGNGLSSVFQIASASTVEIDNLTVSGSDADPGGGISNSGTLTLNNMNVSDNVAVGDGRGGGISNSGSLTVNDSTIRGNIAISGGGIYNCGVLTITNSTISGNTAYGDGGGIFSSTTGQLTVTGSSITGNNAWIGGGGISSSDTQLLLSNSSISGNTSGYGDGGGVSDSALNSNISNCAVTDNSTSYSGGGIAVTNTALVTDCTITGNSAFSSAWGLAQGGGGIYDGGTLTVSDSEISNNTAYPSGGGISSGTDDTLTIVGSSISGNTATTGGGVTDFSYHGDVNVTASTITGNTASQGGGGIYVGSPISYGTSTPAYSASLTVTDSTISGNTAVGRCGGGIYNRYSDATVLDSTISDNYAGGGGGGLASWNGTAVLTASTVSGNTAATGGGIYEQGYGTANSLSVVNSTISGNSSGGGGGIYSAADNSATLEGTIVADSIAGGDLSGSFTGNHNLIDDSTISGLSGSNNLNASADLAPLGDYGGPTETMPPLPASPAIGAGVAITGITTDQRGMPLSTTSAPDIGAFQTQSATNTGYSPLMVNTISDDPVGAGQISLRDAVNLATLMGGNQAITFDYSLAAISPVTINLVGNAIPLADSSGNICLDAEGGANPITVNAAPGQSAFSVPANSSALLEGIAVEGTIGNSGTLKLEGSSISANLVSNVYDAGDGHIICAYSEDCVLSDLSIPGVTYEIMDGATAQVSSSLTAASNLQIDSGSTLQIASGSLVVPGAISFDDGALLNISGGNLIVEGSLTTGTGTTLNITNGYLRAAPGGTITISGSSVVNLSGGSLVIAGTLDDTGEIDVTGGGVLSGSGTVNLGGTTNVSGGGLIQDSGNLALQGELLVANGGSFTTASGAAMHLQSGDISVATGGTFDDWGQVTLNGGTSNLSGGTLIIEAAAQLEVTQFSSFLISTAGDLEVSGTLDVDTGASVQNSGAINLSGGALSIAGTLDNAGEIDAQSGTVTITGGLLSNSSGTAAFDGGTTVYSYGTISLTAGSSLTVNGADLYLGGSIILDQGSATLSGGLLQFNLSSSVEDRDGGLLDIAGGTFNNLAGFGVDSGGTLQIDTALDSGAVNVGAEGTVSVTSSGSLAGGAVTIGAGGTLVNDSTINISNVLSTGVVTFDSGSTILNAGELDFNGSVNLGLVNLQNRGSIQTEGVVTGGGTYTLPTSTSYSHSVYGGAVFGTKTDSGSDVYSYSYSSTSQTYQENYNDTETYSGSGSYAYPSGGGTTSGTISESGGATESEQIATTATLVNGEWVCSGSDTDDSSDYGTSSYGDTGTYVYYVDDFRVSGTNGHSGSQNWNDASNWTLTENTDGSWTLNTGSSSNSAGSNSAFNYNGSGGYSGSSSSGTWSGSTTESGNQSSSFQVSVSGSVVDHAWVYTGTKNDSWLNSGMWNESAMDNYNRTTGLGSTHTAFNASSGENWTFNGSGTSILATDGTWALSSGTGTDTDHNFNTGSDEASANLNAEDDSASLTMSSADTANYTDDTTINLNVISGQWVTTGNRSTHSTDSGNAEVTAWRSYSHSLSANSVIPPVTGTATGTLQSNYSETFDTQSALGSNGSWTTTGSGTSHQFFSSSFGFSGSRHWSYTASDDELLFEWSDSLDANYTEGGSQSQSSDVTTNWVMDPDGNWRAANEQIIRTGESKMNYGLVSTETENYSQIAPNSDEQGLTSITVYRYNIADQSDYTYSDHLNISTDINGVQSNSGTGTGTGSESGSADWTTYNAALYVGGTLQSLDIASVNASNGYAGVWTQNYSANTLNPITQDTAIITTLNTIGDASGSSTSGENYLMTAGYVIPMSTWGGYFGLFNNGQDGSNNVGLPPITFNTGGSPSLGVIGSPTVTREVKGLSIVSSQRQVSAQTFTQPTWITATVWTCRGISAICFLGAGILVAAGYGELTIGSVLGIGGQEDLIPVIGRLGDTAAYANAEGFQIVNPVGWTIEGNAAWIQGFINSGSRFLLASPIIEANILSATNASGFTVFAEELAQILNAGYTWEGSFLLPP